MNAPARGRLRCETERCFRCPPSAAFEPLQRLGGATGYYYADWLWRLRAWIDRVVGGHTHRSTRPTGDELAPGDVIDFWRVERCEPGRLLRLHAEMKLPGEGWLQFDVEPTEDGSRVRQSALFDPAGFWGRVYWYALYPVHRIVFAGMMRNLARHMVERAPASAAGGGHDVTSDTVLTRPLIRPAQVDGTPPCRAACPGGGDVRGWVTLVSQRRAMGLSDDEAYSRAWSTIVERNPFPAVTGRICPHPCEAGCNRHDKDGSVAVHLLERFLGDWAIEHRLPLPGPELPARFESIGVIGAGPAGLSFAYQMARRGYDVTVYDDAPQPGGMLRYGIPSYRLPRSILDAEIARITELGVELRCGTRVGHNVSFDDLNARHRVLFLGIGAHSGRRLGVPGEDGADVFTGADYLRRVNAGERVDLGPRVVVIGGGDTAIDAARVARRGGAEVTLAYRRSRAEMPANADEVDEALEEGVHIEFHVAPVAIRRDEGDPRVRGLVLQRMRLGEPDASGRPRPVPIAGSERELPVETVIAAVAQSPDWSDLQEVRPDGPWVVTDDSGWLGGRVWSGGDAAGLGIASAAIGHGRRAAEEVDTRLRAGGRVAPRDGEPIRVGAVKPERYGKRSRHAAPRLGVEARLGEPDAEVHAGLTEPQFQAEVERCLSCGSCMGCQQCWMYCAHDCFTPLDEVRPGAYFALSLDHCRTCGKCVDLCPSGYLEPSRQTGT